MVVFGLILFGTLCAEKAMAPHSSTLAWKIPWAEKPGRLQSMGYFEKIEVYLMHNIALVLGINIMI